MLLMKEEDTLRLIGNCRNGDLKELSINFLDDIEAEMEYVRF